MCNPALSFPIMWGGNVLTLGVALHAFALGSSDPADPNFEKMTKGNMIVIICTFILDKRAVTPLQIGTLSMGLETRFLSLYFSRSLFYWVMLT